MTEHKFEVEDGVTAVKVTPETREDTIDEALAAGKRVLLYADQSYIGVK